MSQTHFSATSNDYHLLPATPRQLTFARRIAARTGRSLPDEVQADRTALSRWIDRNMDQPANKFANYPSAKQVRFAEHIARRRRAEVPQECFRDKGRMSSWITANK